MATYYVDYKGGLDSADGLSFANRKKTIAGISTATLAPGDTIRVMESPGYGQSNVNASWTQNSNTITLSTNVNILLYNGQTAWTAATADISCTINSAGRRVRTAEAAQVAIGSAFTTGLAAYYPLGTTIDCSGHQGLSFWYQPNVAQASQNLSIRLCSDAVGAVPVSTINIPAINISNNWVPIYVDTGTPFGSSIQSIALYVDTDPGAVQVLLHNINTVKSNAGFDNLNVTSLVGKNVANDGWWPIQAINATTVYLDSHPRTNGSGVIGYTGNTETVALYKTDTTQQANNLVGSQTWLVCNALSDTGNYTHRITVSGGWNSTDMSTQTGNTWFDAMNGWGYVVYYNSRSYVRWDRINAVRAYTGFSQGGGTAHDLGNTFAIACSGTGYSITTSDTTLDYCCAVACGGLSGGAGFFCTSGTIGPVRTYSLANTIIALASGSGLITAGSNAHGVWIGSVLATEHLRVNSIISKRSLTVGVFHNGPNRHLSFGTIMSSNSGSYGLSALTYYQNGTTIDQLILEGNRDHGLRFSDSIWHNINIRSMYAAYNGTSGLLVHGIIFGKIVIGKLVTIGHGTSGVRVDDLGHGELYILNSSIAEATPISFGTGTTYDTSPGRITVRNLNGVAGDHRTYYHNNTAFLFSATDQRHTASGYSWKFAPRNVTIWTPYAPMRQRIASVAVAANTLVNLGVWTYRDNVGIEGKLVVYSNEITGISGNVINTTTAAANTWDQLTMSFTPTETGVIEVEFQAYPPLGANSGATHTLWIDDFSMGQA